MKTPIQRDFLGYARAVPISGARRDFDAPVCEEESVTHPTGKSSPDEPSGDVAVKSDSALPGPAEGREGIGERCVSSDHGLHAGPVGRAVDEGGRPGSSRRLRPLPGAARLGSRGLRSGLPLPGHAARPARGRQGPPRRPRRVASRGGAISPGSPQARAAQPSRHRDGP